MDKYDTTNDKGKNIYELFINCLLIKFGANPLFLCFINCHFLRYIGYDFLIVFHLFFTCGSRHCVTNNI